MLDWLKSYSQSNYAPGQVRINERTCTGCKQCTIVCPASALAMTVQKRSRMQPNADCISCGACTAVCSTGSIRIAVFYHVPDGAYQTVDRRQKSGKSAFPRDFSGKEEVSA